jgi:hypothetical protein
VLQRLLHQLAKRGGQVVWLVRNCLRLIWFAYLPRARTVLIWRGAGRRVGPEHQLYYLMHLHKFVCDAPVRHRRLGGSQQHDLAVRGAEPVEQRGKVGIPRRNNVFIVTSFSG